jgi:hypothetical protein
MSKNVGSQPTSSGPNAVPRAPGAGRDRDTLRVYWQTQLARNAEFESQRMQFSNLVLVSTTLLFGIIAATDKLTRWAVVVAAISSAAGNLIASSYSKRCWEWASIHKHRARRVLADNWTYLSDLQKEADRETEKFLGRSPGRRSHPFSREKLQRQLHHLLAILGAVLALLALAGALPNQSSAPTLGSSSAPTVTAPSGSIRRPEATTTASTASTALETSRDVKTR